MELSDDDDDERLSPMVTQPVRVPQKRKPILRKPSFRRVEHGEEGSDQAHRKLSLYPETASRLEDLTRKGLTGSTTILPGMKLKRSNSDTLTGNCSRSSLAQELFRAQETNGNGRDSKKVKFSSETRGLSDGDNEFDYEDGVFVSPRSLSDPSHYSRPTWMLDENEPLISLDSRSGSSDAGTSSLNTPDMERKHLPEDIYEGLKNSPGTSLVDGRFKVNKKQSNPPLANLFGVKPVESVDCADGPVPSQSSQPTSMPSSLQNLFGPPQNQNQEETSPGSSSPLRERPRPRVLPISPLARAESPLASRSLPAPRVTRSAPSSPEQARWNSLRQTSDPPTPSPENATSVPLKSATRQRKTSADVPLRKTSSDASTANSRFAKTPAIQNLKQVAEDTLPPSKRKKSGDSSSGNSRFLVNTDAQTPALDNSAQVAQAPLASENFTIDTLTPSKPVDMPRSRVSVI